MAVVAPPPPPQEMMQFKMYYNTAYNLMMYSSFENTTFKDH